MEETVQLLVTILLVLASSTHKSDAFSQLMLYVKPTDSNNSQCLAIGQPCYSLYDYIYNTSHYITSNTTLVYMSGTHEFSGGGFAAIKAVNNISWIGDNSESTKIGCDNHSGFAFMNIMGLSIQNLTFVSCGARINQKLSILATNVYTSAAQAYKLNPCVNAALFLTNVHFLTISGISVEHSIGYGLLAINALGNSTLTHSEFVYNNFYTLSSAHGRESLCLADTMNVNRQCYI